MMENKSIFANEVAVVLHRPDTNSLNKVLDLCRRRQTISSNTRILDKLKSISWKDIDQRRYSIQRILSKGENNGI